MKLLIAQVVILLLCGCGSFTPHHNLTQEEWAEMNIHLFKGKSKDEVLKAAATVLEASDPQIEISYTDDSLKAHRNVPIVFIIWDYMYSIKAVPTSVGANCILNVQVKRGEIFKRTVSSKEFFELFFARMDYVLYHKNTWLTCIEAGKMGDDPYLDPLCLSSKDKVLQ